MRKCTLRGYVMRRCVMRGCVMRWCVMQGCVIHHKSNIQIYIHITTKHLGRSLCTYHFLGFFLLHVGDLCLLLGDEVDKIDHSVETLVYLWLTAEMWKERVRG